MKTPLAAILLVLAAARAIAHDTWFQVLSVQPGAAVLSLGTGTRFPRFQFPVPAQQLDVSGCRDGEDRPTRLTPVRGTAETLLLHAAGTQRAVLALTCWAQLQPSEIELAPDIVKVYLDEIHATDAVRQAWAERQARGVAWKERYVKHARVEVGDGPPTAVPTGMDMDVQLEGARRSPRAGEPMAFRVSRRGRPLVGQPMELVDEQQQSGGWAVTDGEGRVHFTAPQAGRWVLRGTALRPAEGDSWESGFVTLAFQTR
jgi:hypothetical protein